MQAPEKGLFRLKTIGGRWQVTAEHFLGDPVPMVLQDSRDGALYAAVEHGHFGSKLHRLDPGVDDWIELDAPHYLPTARSIVVRILARWLVQEHRSRGDLNAQSTAVG